MLPGFLIPMVAGAVTHSNLTFRGQQTDATIASGAVRTFSSLAFGTAATDRYVLVAIAETDGISFTAVTIGGITATLLLGPVLVGSADITCAIYGAKVPTGTTGDITVDPSGTAADQTAIGWWTVNMTSMTVIDSAEGSDPGELEVAALDLDIPADGFAVGFTVNQSATDRAHNPGSNFTEGGETLIGAINIAFNHRVATSAVTGSNVNDSWTGSSGEEKANFYVSFQ